MEAAVVSVLGGASGIVLGIALSVGMSQLAGWQVRVSPLLVGAATVFSAAVGITFGFWPARKASQLAPIEALRYE